MKIPSFCFRSWFWFAAFLLWAIALWILSSGPAPGPKGPSVNGLDKVLHFGYFFGGAGLLSAALFLFLRKRRADQLNWEALFLTVILSLCGIGILDEWHQSWVPERNGNDPGDWLADAYGALAGTLVFRRFHRVLC